MTDSSREIEAVRRRAVRAWHATERKQREALKIALSAKQQMEELEKIIRGCEGRPAV